MVELFITVGLIWAFSERPEDEQIKPQVNAIGKIKESVFFPPYVEKPFPDKGKFDERVKDAKGKSGLYIIKENENTVYVGKSDTQLYKTLTRHFQKWEHTSRQVTYDVWSADYKVKLIYAPKREISDLECKLIEKYNPRDNVQKCLDFSDVPF